MNKKVLIVANDFSTIYNFRLELLRALTENGYEVVIALPEDERNSAFIKEGCEVIKLNLSRFGTNPLKDYRTMRQIKRIIKEIKPLVLLTYTAKANIYGGIVAMKTRTPYICNVTGLGANFQNGGIIKSIMMLLQRHAYKKANAVFFQNQSNLDFFVKKKIVKKNYGLLPGSGVNLSDNPLAEYPENEAITFITVARIRQDKGYDELFTVIKRLYDEGVNAKFVIVGWYEDEKYKDTVKTLQEDCGVIFYENMPHEKVHGLISGCDCLIHPSHHEGMSNVVLEAAAAGRPCIVSDIFGCKECVDDNVTGLYFNVGDAADLYEKVKAMADTPVKERENMGKLARKKIEEQFDRQIVINMYLEKIKQIEDEKNGTL